VVYDPVGNRPVAVDATGRAVERIPALPRPHVPTVDNAAGPWTTITGLTSTDAMSSTIHNPYYRHCQNLNSL